MNCYLSDLSHFFTAKQLETQTAKTSATIFTNWTKKYNLELHVKVDDVKIPNMNNPKILGVTLNSLYSFTPHKTAIAAKLQSRSKTLKAPATTEVQK